MWFEQGPGTSNWQQFWANTMEWSALRPGAYALLSHSASNGYPERTFSTSSDWLSRKRLAIGALWKKIMLKYNGRVLTMPGYASSAAPPPMQMNAESPESSDDESWRALAQIS